MQQNFNHNRALTKNLQRTKEERETFLDLMHCCHTNTHFFLNWQGAGGWGKMLHCMARKQKLNHVMSVKTDTLKCTSRPGPIQCKKTSFRASFASATGKKNICFSFRSEPSTHLNCLSAGGISLRCNSV